MSPPITLDAIPEISDCASNVPWIYVSTPFVRFVTKSPVLSTPDTSTLNVGSVVSTMVVLIVSVLLLPAVSVET